MFPSMVTKQPKDLINKLLVANPAMRLGSPTFKKGSRDVIAHPFFKPLDVATLHKKLAPAPCVADHRSARLSLIHDMSRPPPTSHDSTLELSPMPSHRPIPGTCRSSDQKSTSRISTSLTRPTQRHRTPSGPSRAQPTTRSSLMASLDSALLRLQPMLIC